MSLWTEIHKEVARQVAAEGGYVIVYCSRQYQWAGYPDGVGHTIGWTVMYRGEVCVQASEPGYGTYGLEYDFSMSFRMLTLREYGKETPEVTLEKIKNRAQKERAQKRLEGYVQVRTYMNGDKWQVLWLVDLATVRIWPHGFGGLEGYALRFIHWTDILNTLRDVEQSMTNFGEAKTIGLSDVRSAIALLEREFSTEP